MNAVRMLDVKSPEILYKRCAWIFTQTDTDHHTIFFIILFSPCMKTKPFIV